MDETEDGSWAENASAWFAQLRSLMNRDTWDITTRFEVMDLLTEAVRLAPDEVEEKWVPYITGFPHHFEGQTLTFDDAEAFARWAKIAPSANFILVFEPWRHPLDLDAARRLAASPALGRVMHLALTTDDQDVIVALMGSPHLGGLKWLHVSSEELSSAALEAMSKARFGALTDLVLPLYKADPEGVAALLASPELATLEGLDLHGVRYTGVQVGLGDPLAHAVAAAGQLTRLRRLDMSYNRITAEGARALAGATHLSGITHLKLSDNPLGDDGAVALFQDGLLSPLHLELNATALGDVGVAAVVGAASPVYLELGGEGILDETANRIGPAGVEALASSPNVSELESLSLQCNPFGDGGVRALATSPHLGSLNTLDLADTGMTYEGMYVLAEAPWMARLISLNLGYNNLEDLGVFYIARAEHVTHLEELWLEECDVRDPGAAALANAPHLANLLVLELAYNRFSDEGIDALVNSPHLSASLRQNLAAAASLMKG